MKLKKMTFLIVLGLWLLIPQRATTTAHQCNASGVVEQDNFNAAPYNGWYCSTNQYHARDVGCGPDTATRCSIDCNECGGTWTGSNSTCTSSNSGYLDSNAQFYGCAAPTGYAEKWVLSCNCNYPPPPPICGGSGAYCVSDGDCCSGLFCGRETGVCGGGGSPILINFKSNAAQYHLTSVADGVNFDLSGDGHAERIAWTSGNSLVGFLALDRNGNGVIENGRELFGNFTPRTDGTVATNGFEALKDFDTNHDGSINASDVAFSALQVWFDRNHNGYSEPDELLGLAAAGVEAIATEYTESRRIDEYENHYRFVGTATIKNDDKDRRRRIFDVFFAGQ